MLLPATLILLAGLWQGEAMAKMVIFSAVQGKVLLNGNAVKGAEIVRRYKWTWKREEAEDRTLTDEAGKFSMPSIERSSLLGSLLPHEPVIEQTITIRHQGRDYNAWMLDKRDYDLNGELQGKPIVMTCHLEAEPARHGKVFGICELA
jgi:hypothetical protein